MFTSMLGDLLTAGAGVWPINQDDETPSHSPGKYRDMQVFDGLADGVYDRVLEETHSIQNTIRNKPQVLCSRESLQLCQYRVSAMSWKTTTYLHRPTYIAYMNRDSFLCSAYTARDRSILDGHICRWF